MAWSRCVLPPKPCWEVSPPPRASAFSSSTPLGLGTALPSSKNVPLSPSVSSIRNPSAVMVMSMCFFSFSKSGSDLTCFSSSFLDLLHVLLAKIQVLPRAPHRASHHLGIARGVLEVSAHRLLHLLAGIQQPEHDEQGHHRGHKIGVGHLPRAAVMAAVAGNFLDDDRAVRHLVRLRRKPPCAPPSCMTSPCR